MKFINIKSITKRSNIFNSFIVSKAYTEGIYADTPANRKLGRVGMTYAAYAEKIKNEGNSSNVNITDEQRETLKNTKSVPVNSETYSFNNSFLKSNIDIRGINSPEGSKFGMTLYVPTIKEINGESVNIVYNPFDEKEKILKYKYQAETWIREKTLEYINSSEKKDEKKEEKKDEVKKVSNATPIKTRSLIKSRWNPISIERDIKNVIPNIKDLKLEKINYNDSDEDETYYYLSIPKSNITSEEFNLLKNVVAKYGLSDKDLKNEDQDNYYLESPKWDETGAEVEMSINWPSQKKKLEEKRENTSKIKEKIKSKFDEYKKNNDYISLTTKEGVTIRLDRNKESGLFTKAFAKDKEGKIKTFESSTEDILLNSISNYIIKENLNLEEENKKEEKGEGVNSEQNNQIIQDVIKTAKDNNLGTVIIKTSNGNSIYMNRKRVSRWLKDFEAYSIRDSKRNVIATGKASTEEDLIKKLNAHLEKYKLNLQK